MCALYIPEVRFGNVSTMEPIVLGLVPQERYLKVSANLFCLVLLVQVVLDMDKLFWSCLNCSGWVLIIFVRFKLDLSGLIFMIWTCSKLLGPYQNKLYCPK